MQSRSEDEVGHCVSDEHSRSGSSDQERGSSE